VTVAAVSMVKDEADIIEYALRRMARQVDFLIVADNGSVDGTREILHELAGALPLTVIDEPRVGYYQSERMTALAERAAAAGATWVLAFDADEVWLPRSRGRIANILEALPPNVLMAEAPLFDHVATARDPDNPDPMKRMGWRRAAPAPLRKVACRPIAGLTIHQGNHGVTFDGVRHPPAVTTALEVRHYPYRGIAQFLSKVRNGAAAYAATDLPEHVGGHWRAYGRILAERGEEGLAEQFHEWFWSADPESDSSLVYDPCRA